jgi:hypothetical protein
MDSIITDVFGPSFGPSVTFPILQHYDVPDQQQVNLPTRTEDLTPENFVALDRLELYLSLDIPAKQLQKLYSES